MKMFQNFALVLFLAVSSLSLQAQSAADEQSIKSFLDNSLKVMFSADVEAATQMYAEHAVVVDYSGAKTIGKAAIRQYYTQWFQYEKPEPGSFNMVVSHIRFLNADLALVLMDMSGKSTVNGQVIDWKGTGTTLLSRKNGSWLVELDQSTPIMPMPGN